MWQVVVIGIIFFLIIIFGAQNMHQTRINFPFIGGAEIRTIFLLNLCFFLGFATASFVWFIKQLKSRKKR